MLEVEYICKRRVFTQVKRLGIQATRKCFNKNFKALCKVISKNYNLCGWKCAFFLYDTDNCRLVNVHCNCLFFSGGKPSLETLLLEFSCHKWNLVMCTFLKCNNVNRDMQTSTDNVFLWGRKLCLETEW